jgi:hypothetical protein
MPLEASILPCHGLAHQFDGQDPVSEGQTTPLRHRPPYLGCRWPAALIEKNHRHGFCIKKIVAEMDSAFTEGVTALKKHASVIGAFIAIV